MARLVEKHFAQLVEIPKETNRYWSRIVTSDKEGGKIPKSNRWNYISPEVCRELTMDDGIFDFPPGFDEERIAPPHGNKKFPLVLDGEGWIQVENEIHHFQADNFIFIPAFVRHAWGNDGDVPLKVLFYQPIKPKPPGVDLPLDTPFFRILADNS